MAKSKSKPTSAKPTSAKPFRVLSARAATAAQTPADQAPEADMSQLLEQSERESQSLIDVLEQASRAQKTLSLAQKRIKELEGKHNAEHLRTVTTLNAALTTAHEDVAQAVAREQALLTATGEAASAARSLAQALHRIGDPLAPLTSEDTAQELERLREALNEATRRKDEAPAAVLGRAQELAEVLGSRVVAQGNRVKLLRRQVSELEAAGTHAESEGAKLRKTLHERDEALKTGEVRLKEARTTLGSLEKDLAHSAERIEKQTRSSLDSEAKALKERDRLTSDHQAASLRATTTAKELGGARKQLRAAERLAADLGQLLLDAGDEVAKVVGVELPKLDVAHEELADLVATLGDASDGDLENAFREDVIEDLLPAGRSLAELVVRRHKALGAALAQAQKKLEAGAAKATQQHASLEAEQVAHKQVKHELTRTHAQQVAAQKELEQRSKELTARAAELSTLRGDLARQQAENEALAAQAAAGQQHKAALDALRGESAQQKSELERRSADAQAWESGLKGLARGLVELAAATESALAAAGLKAEGFIGRFTRSLRRLENDAGAGGGDVAVLLRSSLDMADKAASRITQLEGELKQRASALVTAQQQAAELTRSLARSESSLAEASQRLSVLSAERDTLAIEARRAKEVDARLTATDEALSGARSQISEQASQVRQARSELEELRAREAASSDDAARELEALRAKAASEHAARREAETALADSREELEGKAAIAIARASELERAVESRESRLSAVQKELAAASEKASAAAAERKRADQAQARLAKAEERAKALDAELEEARSGGSAVQEAAALRSERDELATRLRNAEKRLADASGQAASLRTTADGLKRKLDEKAGAHRAEADDLQARLDAVLAENRKYKEQLAGLNARVRTLTDLG